MKHGRRYLSSALLLAVLCLAGNKAEAATNNKPKAKPRAAVLAPVQLRPLAVQLDGLPLAARVETIQVGFQVLLPLGELSRLLVLGITVRPEQGAAGGFLLQPDQMFALNLAEGRVNIGGRQQVFDPRLAQAVGGEIFVSNQLLSRWLPVDIEADLSRRELRLKSRQRLPVLARLEKEYGPAPKAEAAPAEPPPRPVQRKQSELEASLLVLEVLLDDQLLSDSFSAFQDERQILLPLGELTRLLTLAVKVQPAQGSATGMVLSEDRPFALNLAESLVSVAGHEQVFEPRLATVIGDDIYVSTQLLARWLPVDLRIDLQRLQLRIKARERLPLQDKLERERQAGRLAGLQATVRPEYPLQPSQPGLIGVPFIDQSLGADARYGRGSHSFRKAYTAYLTSDLLGMEGSAYLQKTSASSKPELRMTLGRNDPEAGLLGPLKARSVVLGNIVVPSVRNLMLGSPKGAGIALSNRSLDQPTSFDRHSLRGDLPPGWDVTLYYNDALIAYQTARPDGQYSFDDLPLSFGANEFRLVFHGPLGQLRVERQNFLLDQASTKPGELFYSLASHHADNGEVRNVAQVDVGLTKGLSANLGAVSRPRAAGLQQTYGQVGLLGYLSSMILSSQLSAMPGGQLADLGLKTRLGSFSLDLNHLQRRGRFDNDVFSPQSLGLRQRQQLRTNGVVKTSWLPTLSLTLDAQRSLPNSGPADYLVAGRVATMLRGTALSNYLRWQRSLGTDSVDGSLQLSRRVASTGLNLQLAYTLEPRSHIQAVALSADRNLAEGYQITGGLLHALDSQLTLVSAGLSKNFGEFGLAISGSYSSQHELAVGVQLFLALGRDPRSGKWSFDGLPLASTGAVSARAFVDRNMNGRRDPDEELVPNAGFIINGGGRHPRLTDAGGVAFLNRLPSGRYADIALDSGTLEDPQWKPLTPGVRVLPRPGRVEMVEFPVISTSEIEGTVYLVDAQGKRRVIGDAQLELINEQGELLAATTSSADGYYLLHQVAPGSHRLRIARDQAAKLGLVGALERLVEVPVEGTFINSVDLELKLVGR
ncbi:hypothetical protein [Pelomonas sp. SE-A7]|uniref:hypothetical protein n=1 Tax=Pelomonas sp. SE-A7 TaxID=3054953 RepID=UPI00259D03C7|nr:hypothetical protein [Pelomonas sp. SE-A7]MDM4764968.1 hypothetical protein [Pelomonas sp. SE-A7]